ncbi:MAG TPA: hypothetical protein VG452_07650, partial [Egibacteraceae bacterium]|nr:hypothetical protein [Egibacteraceae bacterium]
MGWLLLPLALSALAVPPPAAATSCEAQPPGPPYEALAEAAAGVVGTVVATDPESGAAPSGRMVLDVEASLGVDLGARIEVGFSSDVPIVVRERVGLLLTRDEGGWVADSCQRYPA